MKNCSFDPRISLFDLVNTSINGGSANININGELPINVSKTVNNDIENYLIRFLEQLALSASISFTSIVTNPVGDAYKSGIIPLRGVTVEEVNLLWEFTKSGSPVDVLQNLNGVDYNKTVKSAQLQGLSLTFDSILADRQWTIYGDDELEHDGSTAQATATLNFGDRIFVGEGIILADDPQLQTLIQSLDSSIMINISVDSSPKSLDPAVYLYVATPSDKGNLVFRDLNSPIEVDPMQRVKQNFAINNGFYSIDYDIYRSKNGSLRGANIVTI